MVLGLNRHTCLPAFLHIRQIEQDGRHLHHGTPISLELCPEALWHQGQPCRRHAGRPLLPMPAHATQTETPTSRMWQTHDHHAAVTFTGMSNGLSQGGSRRWPAHPLAGLRPVRLRLEDVVVGVVVLPRGLIPKHIEGLHAKLNPSQRLKRGGWVLHGKVPHGPWTRAGALTYKCTSQVESFASTRSPM